MIVEFFFHIHLHNKSHIIALYYSYSMLLDFVCKFFRTNIYIRFVCNVIFYAVLSDVAINVILYKNFKIAINTYNPNPLNSLDLTTFKGLLELSCEYSRLSTFAV